MLIGDYMIGKYPAIIKSYYEDDSIGYETDFDDYHDLLESVQAYKECLGKRVCAHDNNYKIMDSFSVISGWAEIEKELQDES